MTAKQFVDIICNEDCDLTENTVDKFKSGDGNAVVKRVAVCFIATPDLLKEAAAWGADLVITHEPTYYNHVDGVSEYPFAKTKRELIESLGLTLFRFHDHPHSASGKDFIALGFLSSLGWKGKMLDSIRFELDEPKTPREMIKEIEEKLDLHHVRAAGELDKPARLIYLNLGQRGREWNNFLLDSDAGVAIGGEACEWEVCEAARDAAQMGVAKTAVLLGHAASERDGMKYLARLWQKEPAFDGIEIRYFESGETFNTL